MTDQSPDPRPQISAALGETCPRCAPHPLHGQEMCQEMDGPSQDGCLCLGAVRVARDPSGPQRFVKRDAARGRFLNDPPRRCPRCDGVRRWETVGGGRDAVCDGCGRRGAWDQPEARPDATSTLTREELGYLLGCLEIHVADLRARTPEQRRAISPDPQPDAEALLEKFRAICGMGRGA